MRTPPISKAHDAPENDAPVYLIFDSVTDAGSTDATAKELDEINEIRQMILESTDESPVFLTSS